MFLSAYVVVAMEFSTLLLVVYCLFTVSQLCKMFGDDMSRLVTVAMSAAMADIVTLPHCLRIHKLVCWHVFTSHPTHCIHLAVYYLTFALLNAVQILKMVCWHFFDLNPSQ